MQPSSSPVPIDQLDFDADNGTTGSGADAEGIDRVYFVGPGNDQLLRSVPRSASSQRDLIDILLLGPNPDEQAQNYFSSIPDTTEVNSVSTVGTILIVDLNSAITELTGPPLTRALAQIVFTATDQEGIEGVRITVDGEPVEWPGIAGRSMRIYDFPDTAETSQPDFPAFPVVPEE